MNLTGHQVKQLNDFMGGDYDVDVTIEHLEQRQAADGEFLEAGLYVWCTEYPEEGALLLSPVDPDTVGDASDYPESQG